MSALCLLIGLYANAQKSAPTAKVQKPGAAQTASGTAKKKFASFRFFETDNLHDFGTVPEGPKVTYEFTFLNEGNIPLVITNAQASCGCTSPQFPREPILPGKKGKISVTYTTEGHPGKFSKSIYLTSNAQTNTVAPNGQDKYELVIKGIVVPQGQ